MDAFDCILAVWKEGEKLTRTETGWLIARVEELQGLLLRPIPNMWWHSGHLEDCAESSPEEWANNEGVSIGDLLEFQVACRLPNRYYEAMPDPHDSDPETAFLELREITEEEYKSRKGCA